MNKRTLVGMVVGALGFAAQGCQMEDLYHLPGGGISVSVERPFLSRRIMNYSPAKKGEKPVCTFSGEMEIGGEEYILTVSTACNKTLDRVEISKFEGSDYFVYFSNAETKKLELFRSEGTCPIDEASLARSAEDLVGVFYENTTVAKWIEDYTK